MTFYEEIKDITEKNSFQAKRIIKEAALKGLKTTEIPAELIKIEEANELFEQGFELKIIEKKKYNISYNHNRLPKIKSLIEKWIVIEW